MNKYILTVLIGLGVAGINYGKTANIASAVGAGLFFGAIAFMTCTVWEV